MGLLNESERESYLKERQRRKEVCLFFLELGQQCLTCDIYIDGGLFSGSVPVSAAEQAGVLGHAAAHCQKAAVLLARPPTARFLHSHLISGQT